MPDKKLTANEIIKALECCADINDKCPKCPLKDKNRESCVGILMSNALDLINRLQAENEKMQIVKKHIGTLICRGVEYPSAETYERAFEKALEQLYDNTNAKAEAYKEFDERLKEDCLSYPLEKDDITMLVDVESYNNLLKELVGDNDEVHNTTPPENKKE